MKSRQMKLKRWLNTALYVAICFGLSACSKQDTLSEITDEPQSSVGPGYVRASDYDGEGGSASIDDVADLDLYQMQLNESAKHLEVETDRYIEGGIGWVEPTTNHYQAAYSSARVLTDMGLTYLRELYQGQNVGFGNWSQFLLLEKTPAVFYSHAMGYVEPEDKNGLDQKFYYQHELDQRYFIVGSGDILKRSFFHTSGCVMQMVFKQQDVLSQNTMNNLIGENYRRLWLDGEQTGSFVWYTGNAFEVSWLNEASYYVSHEFQNADGSKVMEDFAHYAEPLPFVETDEYYMIAKPFNYGHYKFVMIQPKSSVESVLTNMDAESYLMGIQSAAWQDVNLFIPKFKVSNEIDMVPVWSKLITPRLFEETMDWERAVVDNATMKIDGMTHKAYFSMNARGARSYDTVTTVKDESEVDLNGSSSLWLDKPFIWFIVDSETNIPVMMGVQTTM